MRVTSDQSREQCSAAQINDLRARGCLHFRGRAYLFDLGVLNQHRRWRKHVARSRLLDPRTGNVLSPAAVLIENAKIKEVGAPTKVQAPSGAKVVDLGSATLLPGLITGHAHCYLKWFCQRKPSGRVITTAR